MKIQIRKGVFETNSSSCHSLSYTRSSNYELSDINKLIDKDGCFTIKFHGYGWYGPSVMDLEDKITYCNTSFINACKNLDKIENDQTFKLYTDMLMEIFPTIKKFKFDYEYDPYGEDISYGYIDHQSTNSLANYDETWNDDKTDSVEEIVKKLKNFLLDTNVFMIIDNDNH